MNEYPKVKKIKTKVSPKVESMRPIWTRYGRICLIGSIVAFLSSFTNLIISFVFFSDIQQIANICVEIIVMIFMTGLIWYFYDIIYNNGLFYLNFIFIWITLGVLLITLILMATLFGYEYSDLLDLKKELNYLSQYKNNTIEPILRNEYFNTLNQMKIY